MRDRYYCSLRTLYRDCQIRGMIVHYASCSRKVKEMIIIGDAVTRIPQQRVPFSLKKSSWLVFFLESSTAPEETKEKKFIMQFIHSGKLSREIKSWN